MPKDPPKLTSTWVSRWAELYRTTEMGTRERDALKAGDEARRKGYFTIQSGLLVVRWKSPRSVTYFGRNAGPDVEEITRLALGASDHLKHRLLSLLHGVSTGVAGALLTAYDQDAFTMYDWRAFDSHERLEGGIEEPQELGYWTYTQESRRLAGDLGVSLRNLDRALWMWSKRGHPTET